MIQRLVTVYDRGEDGIYIRPSAFTDVGCLLETSPIVHLSHEEACGRIWKEVLLLLEKSGGTVPHPRVWSASDPLCEMAGCGTWRSFCRGTVCCHVQVTGEGMSVVPMTKDGAGFQYCGWGKQDLGFKPSDEDGSNAVLRALASERAKITIGRRKR
jgi:hypothetical protein